MVGIKRSIEALNKCDLVLLVLDASNELSSEDIELMELTKEKNRIIILNKSDLEAKIKIDGSISMSALHNEGMELLAKKILEITEINSIYEMNDYYLNNVRQIDLMNKAYNSLKESMIAIDNLDDISLIEIDIKEAFDYLGEITGDASPDELINALFTKFCLGK